MDEMAMRTSIRGTLESLSKLEKSKSAFARKCGTTPSNVGHWLAGDTVPSLEKLLEIANVYGLPLSAFVGGTKAEPVTLSNDERELLDTFRSMDGVGRRMLLATARAYRESGEFDA